MLNQSDRQAFPRIGIPLLMFDKNESDIADSILNLRIPQLKYLDFTLKKALYHTIVKVTHQKFQDGLVCWSQIPLYCKRQVEDPVQTPCREANC